LDKGQERLLSAGRYLYLAK